MRVTLIRHGETDYNRTMRMQGQLDIALNKTGVKQAKRLAEILERSEMAFDAAYSSDLLRARQTAELMLPDTPIALVPGLRERFMGDMQGHTRADFERLGAKAKECGEMFDQGEAGQVFSKRVLDTYAQILSAANEDGQRDVAVIAHGGVIRALVRGLARCGKLRMDLSKQIPSDGSLPNCSLTIIQNGELLAYGAKQVDSLSGDKNIY